MSIFGSIMGAIFGTKSASASSSQTSASSAAPSTSAQASAAQASSAQAGNPPKAVDVEAVMNDLAAKSKEKLNWRTSIVDLMKLLKLDSSLGSRKELAKELGYTGSTDDEPCAFSIRP